MSGLLRRIKRSRPADAGEPLPEGQAAAPEGAAPATEPATAVTEPASAESPEPKTETPVLLADPNTPAGVDPATAPMRPPAGRRGRLRRRLRYLRRARELMLRDLGGLLYEVHRTGGGNIEAHRNIVGAKVQRIAGLDAEAHALETALATPRAEAVVFQPGVGGTCPECGELYGSAARFCSNCGSPIGVAALPAPAPAQDPTPTPAPASRESVFGRPAPPTQALSSGDPLRAKADQPTVDLGAGGVRDETAAAAEAPAESPTASDDTAVTEPAAPDKPAASDETAAAEAATSDETAAADEPAASDDTAPAEEPAASSDEAPVAGPAEGDKTEAPAASDETGEPRSSGGPEQEPDTGRNPFSGLRNGRSEEDHSPPELSSGDPLAGRESRS
jgi:hypothetical protein